MIEQADTIIRHRPRQALQISCLHQPRQAHHIVRLVSWIQWQPRQAHHLVSLVQWNSYLHQPGQAHHIIRLASWIQQQPRQARHLVSLAPWPSPAQTNPSHNQTGFVDPAAAQTSPSLSQTCLLETLDQLPGQISPSLPSVQQSSPQDMTPCAVIMLPYSCAKLLSISNILTCRIDDAKKCSNRFVKSCASRYEFVRQHVTS